jgi:succinate dehydrogenase / fumarate reductase cytochrome b subunit
MGNFFTSSIGKKVVMSLSGIFLMLFLVVHLVINAFLMIGDGELYNQAAHFMVSNPVMKVIEPILGLGFIIHILYSITLTIQNMKARPVNYKKVDQSKASTWTSRNMFVLGGLILIFLVIHIVNFFYKLKFGEVDMITYDGVAMHDSYALVAGLFKSMWYYCVFYILGAVFLGLHLQHAFQSAFQTLGLNNHIWGKRLIVIGNIYAFVIGFGFAIIPVFFLIFK